MVENKCLYKFIDSLIRIDTEIYYDIKKKIEKNKPLTREELEYISFYMDRIRKYKK